MEREVRYCTSADGVRIAYSVEGSGDPILALPFFVESFSLDHLLPEYHAFLLKIAEGRRLIRFDPRGIGLSQRDVKEYSAESLVGDGLAVADACGHERLCLWACTSTGPFALKVALQHPDRVNSLILYGTCASLREAFPMEVLEAFATLAVTNWPLACQTLADLTGRVEYPDASLRLADWYRQSTTGPVAAELIRRNVALHFADELRNVEARTLIVHRMDDPTIRFEMAQQAASGIRDSRFVPLEGRANLPPFGDERAIVTAVRAFLDEVYPPKSGAQGRSDASSFRTVLFTDLVSHTEMMARLGDVPGREMLRHHERITREALKECGGTEIKTMGDGFMASFGSVTKAVECAVVLQRAIQAWNEGAGSQYGFPLRVRIGLNAGEPIEEEGDLFGATVILASRIAAKAEGGEILVADTVRGLCSGKGFLFADRGDFVAKGFEEPVRVYEVRWRE